MSRTDDFTLSAASDLDGDGLETALPAAVLWDMDGTLVDTEPYWFAAERDVVERFGNGHWPDRHAHAMVGFALLDSAAYMQEHGEVDLPDHEIVERLLDGVIARLHRRIPWRPGARELLADLNAAGVPCALVTMSWRRFVDPVLAAMPRDAFVASIVGDELPDGYGKPHPEPYLRGAEACGVRPDECIAIEDSPTGVRSALDAGCRVVGVPNVKALQQEPGLTIVESLTELTPERLGAILRAPIERTRGSGAWLDRVGRFDIDLIKSRRLLLALAIVVSLLAVWFVTRSGDEEVALPPGAVPIDVWAPYWTLGDTLLETDVRLPEVREVSPFWFGARSATEIAVDENANAATTAQFLASLPSRTRLVPSISDEMPAGGMAAVLADPTTRAQHIDTLLAFADDIDADGLDLDYEQFAFADGSATWATTRPNWVAFVADLAAGLHDDGRTLTVSIPAVWGLSADADDGEDVDAGEDADDGDEVAIESADGFWVYDHGAIAVHVDAIRIMAYDYSVEEPGPIAPLWWIESIVDTLSVVVPEEHRDKLVLGVGPYGRNWVAEAIGECPANAEGRTNVFARSVLDLAALRGGTPVYDPSTAEWSFTYSLTVDEGPVSCIQNRDVRWIDAEGVAARTELARRAGWGGVALWALGYEDDAVWQALLDAARRPLPVD